MSFLLKIVEGPNKGAEVALVEGVSVTLGKGDGCDIILADPTLPDAPIAIEATASGVTLDGEPVAEFAVTTRGATSFAVGPSDKPWGALVWPKAEAPEDAGAPEAGGHEEEATPEAGKAPEPSGDAPAEKPAERKRRGCFGCIVALLVAAAILLALGLLWRRHAGDRGDGFISALVSRFTSRGGSSATLDPSLQHPDLAGIASRYGLSLDEEDGATRLSGNLLTRRERLAATAEAYQAMPGVELDLSDDESFRASATDALFTLTEGALKVVSATNRVLSVAGSSPSAQALTRTLEALNSDLPKLRDVDVSGVTIEGVGPVAVEDDGPDSPRPRRIAHRKAENSPLPVCGILTMPYPCLVMRDGRRVMEGASIGDSIIVEIGPDSVTLTNSTGRFTWKP